jgi:hypothetical protein
MNRAYVICTNPGMLIPATEAIMLFMISVCKDMQVAVVTDMVLHLYLYT